MTQPGLGLAQLDPGWPHTARAMRVRKKGQDGSLHCGSPRSLGVVTEASPRPAGQCTGPQQGLPLLPPSRRHCHGCAWEQVHNQIVWDTLSAPHLLGGLRFTSLREVSEKHIGQTPLINGSLHLFQSCFCREPSLDGAFINGTGNCVSENTHVGNRTPEVGRPCNSSSLQEPVIVRGLAPMARWGLGSPGDPIPCALCPPTHGVEDTVSPLLDQSIDSRSQSPASGDTLMSLGL